MRYDKVELDHPDGGLRTMSPQEFRAMPLLERVQWLGKGLFRFYLNGERIAPGEALKPV